MAEVRRAAVRPDTRTEERREYRRKRHARSRRSSVLQGVPGCNRRDGGVNGIVVKCAVEGANVVRTDHRHQHPDRQRGLDGVFSVLGQAARHHVRARPDGLDVSNPGRGGYERPELPRPEERAGRDQDVHRACSTRLRTSSASRSHRLWSIKNWISILRESRGHGYLAVERIRPIRTCLREIRDRNDQRPVLRTTMRSGLH